MRKYLTISLLLIAVIGLHSQNTDSLRHLLPFIQKKEKAEVLLSLSKAYWHTHRDTALIYASAALQVSQDNFYKRGIAEAYRHLGVIHKFNGNAQAAQPYLDTALQLFQQLQDTTGMAATYNNLGLLLGSDLGLFSESLAAYSKALLLFRKLGNLEGEGSVLNYMGIAYQGQGNFTKAIEYTLLSLEIRKRIKDIPGVMHSLNNLGNMYRAVGQHKTALKFYREALSFAREKRVEPLSNTYLAITDVYIGLKWYKEAQSYLNLALREQQPYDPGMGYTHMLQAKLYTETGKYKKALPIYKQVLNRSKKGPNYFQWASSLMGISKIYQLQKDYPSALKYAKDAYLIAERHGIRPILAGAANSLATLYNLREDYRKAYRYEKVYRSITDSINTADYQRRLAFVESKSEIEKKQSSIDLLSKENQIKEQRLNRAALMKKIFIVGIFALLFIAFILFRNLSLKRKNERHRRELAENELQMQKLESERKQASLQQQATELEIQALRAQMNPHFIFNSLNSINRFILKKQSGEATEYLTKFSRLIRMILQSSASTTVSLSEDLEALQLYMELEGLRFDQKFTYKIQCDPEVDVDFIQMPPMLLQPYVENAIWHGLMHKEGEGQLWINISEEKGALICTVTDNGIGRKKATELKSKSAKKHKSMGMHITADRIALLQGGGKTGIQINDLTFPDGSAGGTEVIIKIPVHYD